MSTQINSEYITNDEDIPYTSDNSTSIGTYSNKFKKNTLKKSKHMIKSVSSISTKRDLSEIYSSEPSWVETSSGEFSESFSTSTTYSESSRVKSKSQKILTRPSRAYLTKKAEVLARSEWLPMLLKTHPDVYNLRDRLTPLYRALAFSQMYKGKSQISHEVLLQLVMQYLEYHGLGSCVRILEKESKVKMKSRNIDDCRLITLIKLCIKDVEQVYELAMDKCEKEHELETNKSLLTEILNSMNLLDNQNLDNNNVNIWDEKEENIIYEDDNKTISMASLNRLIEKLTPSDNVDQNFVNIFLTTFTIFTKPDIFLIKLIQRYNYPYKNSISDIEYKMTYLPIQIRIINIMKQWIEQYIYDFDENTISNIKEFLIKVVKKDHPAHVGSLLDLLNNRTSFVNYTNLYLPLKEPKPIVPKNIFSMNLTWEDIDDEELARQFTLIEFDIFKKIRITELLNQAWNKSKLKYKAPNIIKMINRFNEVSLWASSIILTSNKLKQRVKILTKLINIADHLRKLNNFSTLMAFVAVFNSSSINRLKHTFSELPPKTLETLNDLTRLMDIYEGHREYKSQLESSSPPCIPYLGMYLSELVFLDEANDTLIGDLINFRKCRILFNIISKIRHYQQIGYNLQSVYQIQKFLLNLQPKLDEKEMYKLSCIIEPKDVEKSTLQ